MKKLYLQRLILISSDIVSIVFSFIVSILVSKVYHEDLLATPFSSFFNPGISKLLGLSIILVFAYMGHYTKRKPFWEELLQILKVKIRRKSEILMSNIQEKKVNQIIITL